MVGRARCNLWPSIRGMGACLRTEGWTTEISADLVRVCLHFTKLTTMSG